jgi:MFS family permease
MIFVADLNRSFMFGYDAGVMTDVIGSNNFLRYFNTDKTSSIIGAINSTFNGGAVFGSLMGGFTMDRFGRKMTIQIGAVVCFYHVDCPKTTPGPHPCFSLYPIKRLGC